MQDDQMSRDDAAWPALQAVWVVLNVVRDLLAPLLVDALIRMGSILAKLKQNKLLL